MGKRMAKPTHGRSYAAQRELIVMAKTMSLAAIAKRTGRSPESILRMAKRIGATIKGRPKPKARQLPDAT
jgi:hypothetical protein